MVNKLGSKDAKWTGYILVRDKEGNPKIDDPDNLDQHIKDMLTDDEYFKIYNEKRNK